MKGKFRILIVDDEDNVLRSLSRLLEDCSKQNYAVSIDTASNNREALQRFRNISFDLVSLDMNMPDFDGHRNVLAGIRLMEELRKVDRSLPIIILSGEDESTIETMLKAKSLENYDIFLKNEASGSILCQKVDRLLRESKISLLAVGEPEPRHFKRQDIINLQAVVNKIEPNGEAHISIIQREDTPPAFVDQSWWGISSYGRLREEPVEIVGVRDSKFMVISSNEIIFLRDCYRNEILAHQGDLKQLDGKVVDINPDLKRTGVEITSAHAPEYLAAKKYWQAVTNSNELLPMETEVDIVGETGGRLRIRRSQTWITNDRGEAVEVVKSTVIGLIGKVVVPIDEEGKGRITIVSENAPDILSQRQWQALSDAEDIFIPGELVQIVGVDNKKLLVREYEIGD